MALSATAHAATGDAPICADRPSKATGTCTVPAGVVQVETGLIDWTDDSADGATSDLFAIGASTIKYGVGATTDVELAVTPLLIERTGGSSAAGFGDTILRVKQQLTRADAAVQVALLPSLKLPTAGHALGNGKIEAAMVVPVGFALGHTGGWTAQLAPEADWLADDDGHGHHPAMVQVVTVSQPLGKQWTVSEELWGSWNFDPTGTTKQASADAALAYLANNNLQFDGGANFGLNRQTPRVELYVGASTRF